MDENKQKEADKSKKDQHKDDQSQPEIKKI